jgi:hypothetical protein
MMRNKIALSEHFPLISKNHRPGFFSKKQWSLSMAYLLSWIMAISGIDDEKTRTNIHDTGGFGNRAEVVNTVL